VKLVHEELDPQQVGGKASGLAKLDSVGARVPEWFVLRHDDLPEDPDEEPSAALRDRIAGGIATWDVVAVRSSMVGEDSAEHSFAGQLESFLFLRTLDEVVAAVQGCRRSAHADRVTAYRARVGLHGPPRMGVIVQRMVEGEVSGVTFTAHPVTGRRDHTLVTAAWGLGEGVVSGTCNADDYVVDRAGAEVDHTVADKDLRIVRREGGTKEEAVEEAKRAIRALSPEDAARIASEAVRIADALGAPQDVEWTLSEGTLHVLQTRPITALPEPENTDGPLVVFDNSNIQESYCGVTTPLTFSFAQAGYAKVYAQTMRAMGLSEAVIQAHASTLRNLLGLVRGRVYYNISNWYRGLLLLPSFGRNKEDMEAMMGLQDPVDLVEDEVLTAGEKLRRLPGMVATLLRLLRAFRRLREDVPRFLAEFEDAYAAADRASLDGISFSGAMDRLDLLDRRMVSRWHIPIVNDFYVMMTTGSVRRLLGDAGHLMPTLMSGEQGIESTEPTKALMRMAARARGQVGLEDAIRRRARTRGVADVTEGIDDEGFAEALSDYVERYGDRCMGELKLETRSLREEPRFIFEVLVSFLDRPDLDADALARRELELRSEAESEARKALGAWRFRRLKKALAKAREAVKNRENMRLARTRMFGLHRDVYRALGRRLADVGRLDDPRDVFYLATDEFRAFHEGRAVTADLAAVAAARKAEFAAYEDADLPHHFSTRGPVYLGNRYRGPERPPADGDLRGIGCYPGVVEAPLRVILSPDDGLGVDGRILCTLRTDPGWAPLFPAASGILVERGSTLSHSAVVARELGIPAVVGVPGLLATVKDGDRVRLDGGTGVVERLET